jgi:hypothetical protein
MSVSEPSHGDRLNAEMDGASGNSEVDLTRTSKLPVVRVGRGHAGVRPSSGAATGFIQATKHFPTARPPHLAAAGTAALRQHRNSTSEFGFNSKDGRMSFPQAVNADTDGEATEKNETVYLTFDIGTR